MTEILIKAASFVAVIILGYLLKRIRIFKEEDFHVLSKIVLKITLPAAIVMNFSAVSLLPSMLTFSLLGLGCGILYIVLAFFITVGKSKQDRVFHIVNMSGYNIGNFTMPFAQGFLGPLGVVTTSLFDTGNALICFGGSYSIASMVQKGERKFAILPIAKSLLKSVPFDTYLIMTILAVGHISLPAPVLSFAGLIANANAFLSMLMIGIGFRLSADLSCISKILKLLGVRYGVAVVWALACFLLLLFPLEVRQALAILAFAPVPSSAAPFTADLECDFGLASAVSSISIMISIVLITGTLFIVL